MRAEKKGLVVGLMWSMALISLLAGCGDGNKKEEVPGIVAETVDPEASDKDKKISFRQQGLYYMNRGDYKSAQKAFEMALECSNGLVSRIDMDICCYLGVCEYRQSKFEEAKKTFTAVVDLDDEDEDALLSRGIVDLALKDREAALSDFDRVLTLGPSDYDNYRRIFDELEKAGYHEDAVACIDRAFEKNERMDDYDRGIFSYYLEKYDDARNYLEKARNPKKEDPELLIYLGRTYEALGDAGYAVSLYQNYIDTSGKDASVYNELGLAKLRMSDPEGALAAFRGGLAAEDGDEEQSLRFNEISACEALSDFSSAKERAGEYIKDYPADEEAKKEYEFLSTR